MLYGLICVCISVGCEIADISSSTANKNNPRTSCSQDEDFPNVSAFHRRALFHKLGIFRQTRISRQLKAINVQDYTGVHIRKNNAIVTMGEKNDVQLYRSHA